jgi:hypothetical protein
VCAEVGWRVGWVRNKRRVTDGPRIISKTNIGGLEYKYRIAENILP